MVEIVDEHKLTENQKRNTEIFQEYALWRAENGAQSPETQKADKVNVMQFLRWYGDRPILEVKKIDVLGYAKHLKEFKYQRKPLKGQQPKQPKNYSEMTQFEKKKGLRVFLHWLNTEYNTPDLSTVLKLKSPKRERQINYTITYDDAMKLIKVCQNTRDKALIHFLLDAGVRRSELLSITFGGVKFTDGGIEVSVPPKKNATEGRRVFCVHCTKDMRIWWENHPLKTPDSYFFCSAYNPYGQFSYQGLFTQLKKIANRAGFEENIYPHLFRHSSASIFTTLDGMNSFKINKRYGWKLSSKMADVYAHLTGRESDDDIKRAFGAPIRRKTETGVEVLYCPRCKLANNIGDDRCYNCEKGLSPEAISEDKLAEEAKQAKIMDMLRTEMYEALKTITTSGNLDTWEVGDDGKVKKTTHYSST
jgi:site-specific recombinase XerD